MGDAIHLRMAVPSPVHLRMEKSGGEGTGNYERLVNKPSIEGHTLVGDSTLPQIGVGDITEQDIDRIIFGG